METHKELAILKEFEERFSRLESTIHMILDCDLHERLSALEELMQQQQQRATADPMREVNLDDYMQDSLQDSGHLGISLEGEELEDSPDSRVGSRHTDSSVTGTKEIKKFFSQHSASSLVQKRRLSTESYSPQEYYRFEDSTWDLAVLGGTTQLGRAGTVQTMLLVFMTVLMQCVYVGIAWNNFLDPEVTDSIVQEAVGWRNSYGHSFSVYDRILGKSLVERVCDGDKSLHLSGIQVTLHDEIRKYLKPEANGFAALFTGQTLCVVALLCWYMMVAKEISQALALHRGIMAIPTGASHMKMRENPFTQVLEFRLTTASSGRKLLSFFLLLYRLIAAALLLYVGSFFLVYTVNITDLILNTVSLGIILDIDNYIFAALATTAGKSLMSHLEPLRIPPYRRYKGADLKSVMIFVVVPFLTICVSTLMLMPMSSTLSAVSNAMCGGNKGFIWTVDKRGITLLAPTAMSPNTSRVTASNFRTEQAIGAAGGFTPGPHVDFAVWVADPLAMEDLQALNLDEQLGEGNPSCTDLAAHDETMMNYLRDGFGNYSISTCSDVAPFCNSITTLPDWGLDGGRGFLSRMLCSDTCGCSDPGGEFMFVQGCPFNTGQCLSSSTYKAKLQEATCHEKSAEQLRGYAPWISWISSLRRFGNAFNNSGELHGQSETLLLAEAMWDHGCDFHQVLDAQNISWGTCYQWSPLFDWGFKTLAFFCPMTCGCDSTTSSEQDLRCPMPQGRSCEEVVDCIYARGAYHCTDDEGSSIVEGLLEHTKTDVDLFNSYAFELLQALQQCLAKLAGDPVLAEDVMILFSSPARVEFQMLVVNDLEEVTGILSSHSASHVSSTCLTFMNNKSIPVSAMGLELGLIDIYGIGPNNLDANNTTDGMPSVPSGPGAPIDERPDPPEGGSGPRP